LTDNVQATVALVNERVWNEPSYSSGNTDISLLEAYVTLREMLYSPLTVVVGRQNFMYGKGFVVASTYNGGGDSALSSVAWDISGQYATDAIRAILDYDPLTVELLYAKIDENYEILGADQTYHDDVDLYGINATYELGDDMDTVIEGYFFAKIDTTTGKADSTDFTKNDTIYVPGIRASMNVLEGLNISAEYAHQSGTKASATAADNQQKRDANAVFLTADYSLPLLEDYDPTLSYLYIYASGDNDPAAAHVDTSSYSGVSSDEKYTAWDPFFEDVACPKIYNALFSMSNVHVHELTLAAKPLEDVAASVSMAGLWMAQDLVDNSTNQTLAINQPDGNGTATVYADPGKRMLGYELDLNATYDYTEDVQFGATLGYFFPGNAFDAKNRDAASQALINCAVSF